MHKNLFIFFLICLTSTIANSAEIADLVIRKDWQQLSIQLPSITNRHMEVFLDYFFADEMTKQQVLIAGTKWIERIVREALPTYIIGKIQGIKTRDRVSYYKQAEYWTYVEDLYRIQIPRCFNNFLEYFGFHPDVAFSPVPFDVSKIPADFEPLFRAIVDFDKNNFRACQKFAVIIAASYFSTEKIKAGA